MLSKDQLVRFFTLINNYVTAPYILFVIFIWPSSPMFGDLLAAMKEIGAHTTTTVQWGTYVPQGLSFVDKTVCIAKAEVEMVVYFGISSEKN